MNNNEKVTKICSVTEKVTKFRWVVMALIFILYAIANADRSNLGIALPFIRKELNMSNTDAGAISSMFFLGYAMAMIPSGFLVSKLGVRKTFSFAMILTSIAAGAGAFITSGDQLKVARFLVGVAEAPLAVGVTATINNWFPAREKGTAAGLWLASTKFGPLLVPVLSGLILQKWGWRHIFTGFALPGFVFAIIWFLVVANRPGESHFCSKGEVEIIENDTVVVKGPEKPKREYKLVWLDKLIRAKKVERLSTNKELFTSWNIIGAAFGYFFMLGIVSVLTSWIPTYLSTVKQLEVMKMALVASAPFAGTVVGNVIGGLISDRFLAKRRKPLMMVSAGFTAIMMYSLIYSSGNPISLAAQLFLMGVLFSLGFSGYMIYATALVSKEKYPLAASIVNTGGQLGGFATPLVVGMILDKYNWNMVFATIAAGCFACLLILFTLVEPVDDPLV